MPHRRRKYDRLRILRALAGSVCGVPWSRKDAADALVGRDDGILHKIAPEGGEIDRAEKADVRRSCNSMPGGVAGLISLPSPRPERGGGAALALLLLTLLRVDLPLPREEWSQVSKRSDRLHVVVAPPKVSNRSDEVRADDPSAVKPSTIIHDLRIANFDAPPITDARTENAIPFIQSAAVTAAAAEKEESISVLVRYY